MVFDILGGKKIDTGLPSAADMIKGKGGFKLLESSFSKKNGGSIGLKPIKLSESFSIGIKSKAPARQKINNPIGLGEGLKKGKKELPLVNAPFLVGNLDQNVKPSAEAIRRQAFDQLDRVRGAGLEQVGTAKGVRTDADKFAFGIQNKPIRDQSVISNRKFEFFTMQDGVLQRKEFRDKELAEAQRRKAEAQGDLELVSTVREIRV